MLLALASARAGTAPAPSLDLSWVPVPLPAAATAGSVTVVALTVATLGMLVVVHLLVRRTARRAARAVVADPVEADDPTAADEATADAELDALHTAMTGVAGGDVAMGRHPVTGQLHIRKPHRAAAYDPARCQAPVPRAVAADDQAGSDPSGEGARVPDLAPGSNAAGGPIPQPGPAGDPLTALAAAAGDAELLSAVAHHHPEVAYTAHLLAAAADHGNARHLYAAADLAPTDVDDRAEELRSRHRLPVPLPHVHAVATTSCDHTGLMLAVAAAGVHFGERAAARDAADLVTLYAPSALARHLLVLTDPTFTPTYPTGGETPTTAGVWRLLDRYCTLAVTETGDGDTGHALAAADALAGALDRAHATGEPTDEPTDTDVVVDWAALRVALTVHRARLAWRHGDLDQAVRLAGEVLAGDPGHRAARALLRRINHA